jgi:hypothetical protein
MAPFDRLAAQVMAGPPYKDARRVFMIVDNGTAHRGQRSVTRAKERYPKSVLVHGPVPARWLNQIETCFSIMQRKVLSPNDSRYLQELGHRSLDFQCYYEQIAKPFEWKFTRRDLNALLNQIQKQVPMLEAA